MALFDIHDIGQIATLIGIPSILISIFMQLRSYKKDQKELAEKNRLSITTEINDKTQNLFEKVEDKLEVIKTAAVITKEDITALKTQVNDLRRYVDELDKTGTVEWLKTKPFLMERIKTLDGRIDELDGRFTNKIKEVVKEEVRKEHEGMKERTRSIGR